MCMDNFKATRHNVNGRKNYFSLCDVESFLMSLFGGNSNA